jgi:hypothetical protein
MPSSTRVSEERKLSFPCDSSSVRTAGHVQAQSGASVTVHGKTRPENKSLVFLDTLILHRLMEKDEREGLCTRLFLMILMHFNGAERQSFAVVTFFKSRE